MKFASAIFNFDEANVCLIGCYFRKREEKELKILRKYSYFVEPFDWTLKRNLLENVKICDLGNFKFNKVSKIFKKVIDNKKFPVIFCKNHLITYYILKNFYFDLIVFDAHLDLKSEHYSKPEKITENKKLNKATWLRRLSEEKNINVCVIGARSFDEDELKYAKSRNIKINRLIKSKKHYLSIDLDFLDPIYINVNFPEPLGISFFEALRLLKKVVKKCIALDIVEFDLSENGKKSSIYITKLLYFLLHYKFS